MSFLKSNFRLRPPLSSIDSRLNYSRESLLTQESGTEEGALELLCRITARRLVLFARIIELRPMRLYDPLSLFALLIAWSRVRRESPVLFVSLPRECRLSVLCSVSYEVPLLTREELRGK